MLALAGTSTTAAAVGFSGSYTVNALGADPGLVIRTATLSERLELDLEPGKWKTVKLFDIWTDETAVNFGDDFAAADISVAFDFGAPIAKGTVTGTTTAATIFVASKGVLRWDGPAEIAFGDGGLLRVSLGNEIFNGGLGLGLMPGRQHGATVHAKFRLVSEPVSQVPLPAGLPLLASAMGGIFLLRQRRSAPA
jgi:hypothetical protein